MALIIEAVNADSVALNLKLLALVLLATISARLLWNYTRLRQIPGPFLASFTDLWRVYAQYQENSGPMLQALHKKYGLVVRVGPNAVSVADPGAVPKIYGTKTVYKKAPSNSILDALTKAGKQTSTLASTRDEIFHSSMKRPIASAFTANAISDYEHQVDETIIEFVHAATSSTEPIVLNKWLQWYAMDVLNRIAFSATPGFIEQRRDVADTLRSIQTRFFHWSSWGPLHTLNSLLLNIPVYSALRRQPPSPVSILAQAKLASRTAADTNVRQDLLQKYLDARKEHKDTLTDAMVLGLTVSTIAAGADTSGISILIVLYHVYRNPEVLHRLREEITDFKKQGHLSDPYKISETQKMPYLEIVVREALRVHTVVTLMLERLVPAGGLEVAGKYLPEGTVVGCSPWVIHQQESIYGPNPEEFKPERWFVDEEKRRMMDRFSLEFGAGKRVCIGKNIAKLNIYKIVPCIINDLEIEFLAPHAEIKLLPNALAYTEPLLVDIRPRS